MTYSRLRAFYRGAVNVPNLLQSPPGYTACAACLEKRASFRTVLWKLL